MIIVKMYYWIEYPKEVFLLLLLFLNICKDSGMRIMNDRVGKDSRVGKYTCITESVQCCGLCFM